MKRFGVRFVLIFLCGLIGQAEQCSRKLEEPRRQAEITLRLVEAGSAPDMLDDAASLVPQELKTLLTFGRYHLLDSGFIRGKEKEKLTLTLAGNLTCQVEFKLRNATDSELEYEVRIQSPKSEKGSAPRLLETSASGKSGETIVLGASRMRDSPNALIVMLTGKLVS
jgi:hypothetical protein